MAPVVQSGNTGFPGEDGRSPGERSLFFVRDRVPWNWFFLREGPMPCKASQFWQPLLSSRWALKIQKTRCESHARLLRTYLHTLRTRLVRLRSKVFIEPVKLHRYLKNQLAGHTDSGGQSGLNCPLGQGWCLSVATHRSVLCRLRMLTSHLKKKKI